MTDRFISRASSLDGPATHGFPVTPSDTIALVETTRALFVGQPGDVSVVFSSGASVTFGNVAGGTLLPVRVTTVMATGTTASNLIALV